MSDKSLDIEIGRRLRQARITKGLTQKDVATKIGISHQAYQKYELGTSRISVSTVSKINDVLPLTLAELLPTTRTDGTTIQSPTAAIGSSITGVRLSKIFATLDGQQQRALLDVAKAMQQSAAA